MLGQYLKAALGFLLVSVVSAQTIIFVDYTDGFTAVLPTSTGNPVAGNNADPRLYSTATTGSFSFGVDWNNDADDTYTITVTSPITVTALNSPSFCSTNTSVVFTATSVHTCNYTASWTTTKFSGEVIVAYGTGLDINPSRTESVTTFLVSPVITGDPQFVGLRGQSYQVHGVDGAVYNIISEKNTQVNSRFTFLTEGECPIIDGVPADNCWSHAGSYLGEMSFQQVVDGKLHAALVTAGDAKKGFSMVQMDGKALKVGDKVAFDSFSIELLSAYKVKVETERFEFELDNSDMFINQALRSKVALSKLQSHGLLGQTHSSKVHSSPLKYIEGEVDDYVIADNDIFGSDFLFNKFQL